MTKKRINIEINPKLTLEVSGYFTEAEQPGPDSPGYPPEFDVYDIRFMKGCAYELVMADITFDWLRDKAIEQILQPAEA